MKYIDAIRIGFPAVICHTVGETDTYESIVWDGGSPMPSQQTLDEWISANGSTTANDSRRVTVLAFRNRFTMNEKVAIEMASMDNPSAAAEVRQFSAMLRAVLRDLDTATFVDLNRTDTRTYVMLMEQYGIVGPGRATIILDTAVQEVERPLTRDYSL